MSCRIEDYGLIGDCETAALVGRDGSIDWLCWPAFDSDACFAGLLGTRKHGRWLIAPAEEITKTSRRYWGDTLILETRFETANGVVALIDFMPPRGNASDVVRLVRGVSGKVKLRMELIIRFGFGADIPWVKKSEDGTALLAICGPDMTVLRTPVETRGEDLTTVADFEVGEGQTVPFVLTYGPSHLPVPAPIDPAYALQDTENFWTEWCSHCIYEGVWPRSRDAIADHAEGADLWLRPAASSRRRRPRCRKSSAAPRNWDYRFCWLRDATFTLLALMNSGYTEEAVAWHNWLLRAAAGAPANMQIMYGIMGQRRLLEWEARLAARLRRRAAGAGRQCRACPVAARRLWRTDRRVSPVAHGKAASSTRAAGRWNARCWSIWRKYGISRITASGSGAATASTMSPRK